MSCAEVMYQPYTSYFPRHTNDYTKRYGYGLQKLQDLADGGSMYTGAVTHASPHQRLPPAATVTKEEADAAERDAVQPTDAKYLSASCLLLTYFTGDIASNVDEHFTRALSQPSSYSAENQGSKPPAKDHSPMSHRNFPPSFWNSAYVGTPPSLVHGAAAAAAGHHDLSQFPGADPYLSAASLHHGMAGVHHPQDAWHYPLTSQAHTYAHRAAVHDLTYSPMHASSSRFASHFSPLLPAGRLGASIHGQTAAESWPSRYHGDHHMSGLTTHPHTDTKGLEALTHDSSKDIQWY